MPGLPVPLLESRKLLTYMGISGAQVSDPPQDVAVTYTLASDVTVFLAELVDANGVVHPMVIGDGVFIYTPITPLPLGPITVRSVLIDQYGHVQFGRDQPPPDEEYYYLRYGYDIQFSYTGVDVEAEAVSSGGHMLTSMAGAAALLEKQEFRFSGTLVAARYVEIVSPGTLRIAIEFPSVTLQRGVLLQAKYVSMSFAAKRLPADHLLQLQREDDELLLMI